ncbi:MAG: hypothetical protein A2V89_04290 [Gammaproteobacteria bacterium RBG_16_37_9]|nr:MAG: hypothetical protein A2V89_04290 [Gammaproteobacteria bacterium RBG_16_37_9]
MITSLKKLAQTLRLNLSEFAADNLFPEFPLQVPESFVARIKQNDINDPLLLQILPQQRELQNIKGFNTDPIFEKKYSPITGLIHKYHGRVLLLVTDNCVLNCRFCFRRHLREKITDWQKVFSYIKNDSTVTEVILSGGDPLMLAQGKLKEIMDQLAQIPHIKRIRIHSRVPIAMPKLVTSRLIQSKIPVVLMVHCNHSNEINDDVVECLDLLRKQNITIFNQAVLLKGVNDDSEVLVALSEKLFSVGVIPCYLHILDKVKGAAHFYVNIERAKKIYSEMQKKLSGFLVPKLVVEVKNKKKYV